MQKKGERFFHDFSLQPSSKLNDMHGIAVQQLRGRKRKKKEGDKHRDFFEESGDIIVSQRCI